MDNLFQAILLGVIEGITGFLPISSTGHLLIEQHWLGRRSDLFTVAIQSGAILAVTLVYWRRLRDRAVGFAQPENRDYVLRIQSHSYVPLAWYRIALGVLLLALI